MTVKIVTKAHHGPTGLFKAIDRYCKILMNKLKCVKGHRINLQPY